MRYTLISVMTAFIVAAAAPAFAHGSPPMAGEVGIEIVSDSGRVIQSIPHQDFWKQGTRVIKSFLEATRGENYGIVIRNRTSERIGVVIAVDGRNIISGKRSDLGNHESMYIVNGHADARYTGWRTGSDRVHKFYFTDMDDSYAVRTFQDSSAMGVIAVAVFREKARPQPRREQERMKKDAAPAAPRSRGSAEGKERAFADESAGTGFGDEQYSPSIQVAFRPERRPFQQTLIKYEWREVLCRNGILRCAEGRGNRLWDEAEYAPYPPGHPARR